MYKRILVAVDASAASQLALNEALKLAEDQKASLRIAYVADEFLPIGEGAAFDFKEHDLEVRAKGQALLNSLLNKIVSSLVIEGHLIEIAEPGDSIAQAILDHAKEWQADLIVMGTRGNRGLKRFLLGSVAEELSAKASIPVQLVHQDDKFF